MTIERKILFGLGDIRTISYACNKCGARATFPPGGPTKDPSNACYACAHPWRMEPKQQSPFSGEPSMYAALLQAISTIKALEKELGFKMLFELDESSALGRAANDRV
jgi:hypothetical protein